MIAKMRPVEQGGSRLAIVFNGSPLFTGAAGSGESEIRRWIIENDWLDAVVALPDQLFYNTGISTYFWIVTNRKTPERRGTVQLIDARDLFVKMRKSLGEKRKEISGEQIAEITRLYHDHAHQSGDGADRVKIFPNETFGFLRITVERPLRVRYEMTGEAVEVICASKQFGAIEDGFDEPIRATLQALVGRLTRKRLEMDRWLIEAAADHLPDTAIMLICGLPPDYDPETEHFPLGNHFEFPTTTQLDKPLPKPLEKVFWSAVAVSDPDAPVVTKARGAHKGEPEPDPDLRDQENVPLPSVPLTYEADVTGRLETPAYQGAIEEYVEAEVLPYVGDAWVDHTKTKIGYEIPLTRHFYTYTPPRPLAEIDAEIKQLEAEIQDLLREVTE